MYIHPYPYLSVFFEDINLSQSQGVVFMVVACGYIILYCGSNNDKPPIWEWYIPPIDGDLGDGSLLLSP